MPKTAERAEPGALAAPAAQPLALPRLCAPWPGQGGLFAGLLRPSAGQPDQVLILATALPPGRLNWKAAIAWAKTVEAEGHSDFTLPTRADLRLLYINLRDQFEQDWYWSGEQDSADNAFHQFFLNGYQHYDGKKYEGCVRAVRRFNVESFNPFEVAT